MGTALAVIVGVVIGLIVGAGALFLVLAKALSGARFF